MSARSATNSATEPNPNSGELATARTTPPAGRSQQKRIAIMDAATALFLNDGYRNTSMDQVAAAAEVSKQTVYKNFADKEQLFRSIVLGVTANSEAIIGQLSDALGDVATPTAGEMEAALLRLGQRYLDGVLSSKVLALRRIVIAEAERFPDLADSYYQQAPARGMAVLATALQRYERAGLLAVSDPDLAAAHFAYLVLGYPQDRAQFYPHEPLGDDDRDRLVAAAVRVFLAAYGRR